MIVGHYKLLVVLRVESHFSDFSNLQFGELRVHNEVQYQFSDRFGELWVHDELHYPCLVPLWGVNGVARRNLPD